ncbi:hypothetical protein O9K63_02195 [Janibacter cremeus]|uniref:hypothetical protein n=1 Tax=Janibacter cremeus TaxID=1285192 RepID=UPI0023F64A2C|nr:hypothetical protein [Janibacter cremeus]WEV78631.1 hypothetical protein O9K63_02195 [Janibacter cremeus]
MATADADEFGLGSLRAIAVLGAIAGVALVVDIAIITITNSHIEPLDSILFFIGLGAMVLTLAAVAVHVGAGHEGAARVGYTVLAFIAVTLVGATISFVADAAGRRVFSPDNIGLHGEWSFFSVALCLLALSVWAARRGGAGRAAGT